MQLWIAMFWPDIEAMGMKTFSMWEIFRFVARLPYAQDFELLNGEQSEILTRPARWRELGGLDCKKKAILIACWARANRLPYRLEAVDYGRGVSHVFPAVKIGGAWVNMDASIFGQSFPGDKIRGMVNQETIGGWDG